MCQCLFTTSIIDGLALGFWDLWGFLFVFVFRIHVLCAAEHWSVMGKIPQFLLCPVSGYLGCFQFFSFYEQSLLRIDFKMLP